MGDGPRVAGRFVLALGCDEADVINYTLANSVRRWPKRPTDFFISSPFWSFLLFAPTHPPNLGGVCRIMTNYFLQTIVSLFLPDSRRRHSSRTDGLLK